MEDKVGNEAWDSCEFVTLREGQEECWGWW